MSEKKFTITVNEQQAQLLVNALDLYSRVGLGQFEEVGVVYYNAMTSFGLPDRLREAFITAKIAAGHPSNGSYGIHSPEVHDKFRNAWDIQQVIRNCLAWDRNPKGGFQVNFDEPRQIGTLSLPKMEKL